VVGVGPEDLADVADRAQAHITSNVNGGGNPAPKIEWPSRAAHRRRPYLDNRA
jgi:hypothetical protein